ncbi:MAG TPA: N-acetylmuramoyl-L-alanine amidase [Acidobacteriaceae bacterium]|nr:N-acetylmuramoyl-L-alanine amidase [Acidobacteriaceae bacterium]
MRVSWQSEVRFGRGLGCVAACAGVLLSGQAALGSRAETSAWDAAVVARQVFEAKPQGTHTKIEYAHVMDEFRAIYHGNPGDAHAARAVEQVAELLAEEGQELNDRKALRDAAGQYEFLAKAYPGGLMAPRALGHALELLGPDAADDAAEAKKVRGMLEGEYPRSAEAREAKKQGLGIRDQGSGAAVVASGASDVPREGEHYRNPASAKSEDAPVEKADSKAELGAEVEAERPASVKVDADRVKPGKMAVVTGIRHWSTPSYTRVAIDLGDAVEYQAARVEHPDRIFFDLHHARLAQQLVGKSFAVTDDGFLTRIRAAQFSGDVTRVVLDVHQVGEYSAFLLPNPYRLIIDIHGKQNETLQDAASDRANESAAQETRSAESSQSAASGDAPAGGMTEVSSLPPMPVTDGSAGFGLPSRDGAAEAKQAVARPRVIIPSKPTTSKPVPNSVATKTADDGVEVAAVSDQPGKIEATRRPTSQPIAERSRGASAKTRGSRSKAHVTGEPAEPPPPTADGDATLMRALGLKIGRIVIDAGHGGHDSGTLGAGGIEEKDVVLDVALRLGKLLHDRLGADVVYTRADDTFIPLETRTAIANKAQADLFISVHANSSTDASARGVEVYYLNFTSDPEAMQVASRENAVSTQSVHELSDLVKKIALKDKIDESRELAEDVDQSLYKGLERGNEGLKNRGVKKAPFVVLIGANMPSILAEISFVTNPTDADELRRPEYRERVAESLYAGVARYAKTINGVKKPVPTERASIGGAMGR